MQRWIDGFKPAIESPEPPAEDELGQGGLEKRFLDTSDVEKHDSLLSQEHSSPIDKGHGLKRNLESRHILFIALGGGIGTGLFIGSGSSLASSGPGSLLIDYTLIGVMILTVLFALGELATVFPVPGAFAEYTSRFLDPAWGFAIGYNYWMQWIVTLPLEFTAASIVVQFWDPDEKMPRGALIAIFFVLIVVINLFGVRGYAEVEFSATCMKMVTLVGFVICGIVIDCGGTPAGRYLGATTWHDPGAFNNAFKGFCSVFTTAAFAFTGTELVGLAAAEAQHPHKQIPRACKLVIWRVVVFYFLSLFLITLIVPYSEPRLHGTSSYDPNTSPFVLAIQIGGIKVLPHLVNAVIMLSALSVSNSSAYAASRTLHALAEQGKAPHFLRYIDRSGRPLWAVVVSILFGLLGFLVLSGSKGEVFNWLIGISGLSVVFTWGSVCAAHIRFRKAWRLQGHTLDELPWTSPFGVFGSWVGMIFNILVVCAKFYVSAFPIGEESMTGMKRAYEFFVGMVSLPIVLLFFFLFKIIRRTRIVRLREVDLVTGRRAAVSSEMRAQERADARARPAAGNVLLTSPTLASIYLAAWAYGAEPEKDAVVIDQELSSDGSAPTNHAGGVRNANEPLKRRLQGRHIQFIALGGSIGTGLFIGSGNTLQTGGPAFLMIDFLIIAVALINVVFALGELAAVLPVSGAFSNYAARFLDPSWGFAMGYNYWLNWLVTLPLEATAATIVIQYWDKDQVVPQGVWIALFLVFVTIVNLFGVRAYGEVEFITSLVKVLGCIGFIICAIVIDVGGTPARHYFGAHTWHDPGPITNGFKGFSNVFTTAAFAFSGTELIGIAAAETEDPRVELPKACKQVVLRILIFYVLSLFMITLIVPYDMPALGGGSSDPRASPFVIAIELGGIRALPSIFNAVILFSCLSVGNASVYGASRTLLCLAEQGMAPKLLRYVDREGRPLVAVTVSLLFGLLGFLIYSSSQSNIFDWLLSISALVVVASFYVSAFPIGEGDMTSRDRAQEFFIGMLSLVITIFFYFGHKLYTRSRVTPLADIDLHSDRREPVPEEVLDKERAEARARPLWRKALSVVV
ncbi:hypothetical protein MSPP1_000834 [Malassezia sp. CBS 17886]|nr:hypothetical protein MSPP1_000834 [Malassezia sp. CBS 17886]